MGPGFMAYVPALGLLLVLIALAWGVGWAKKKQLAQSGDASGSLRLVSQMAVGPQQRVVVVTISSPQGPVQLTLGVSPQQVNLLHTSPTGATAAPPSYADVAQRLQTGPEAT